MKHELFFCDPSPDTPVMPGDEPLIMDSHGSRIFGRLLRPAFYDDTSTAPIVLMMHGHPGGDSNLDIAAYLRANGFAVAHFHYRGVWGSHGDYCLSHNIEDVTTVASYLRQHAAEFRLNPDRLYLFGHSMGGFSALNAIAAGLKVSGAILMAPCDTGYMYLHQPERFGPVLMSCKNSGYFRLPSEDYMEQDTALHAEEWYFPNLAPRLDASIPYRFLGGARDITTPPQKHILPLLSRLQELGIDAQYTELDDGHVFPISRVRLARTTLGWLSEMEAQQNKRSLC